LPSVQCAAVDAYSIALSGVIARLDCALNVAAGRAESGIGQLF
jgi:hypothetical protein